MSGSVSIMVVNIKCKRFIPDVARIRNMGDSAVSPKASKQTIQQAPSARKKTYRIQIRKKAHTENGILLLKICLTVSWPGASLESSFTLQLKSNKPNKFDIKSLEERR